MALFAGVVFNRESGMMLGSPIPVQLPYDASEDRLIVRRQNKLARDIDIIQQKIRNNVYSAAEKAIKRFSLREPKLNSCKGIVVVKE